MKTDVIQSDKERLIKRARAKYLSHNLSLKLINGNPGSDLIERYRNTYYCAARLDQKGNRITTKYCKSRWCATCNRIRTAKLINGYAPPIKAIQGVDQCYFVTLTKKTVLAADLEDSIKLMGDTWRLMLRSKVNRKAKVKGIRKTECTIRPDGHYHYHYHVIIQGFDSAKWLLDSWLERMGENSDPKGQDIRVLDENGLKEIFKYFTKLTTPNGSKRKLYEAERMDIIFNAISGMRTFQPFGGLRMISEDINDIQSEDYNEIKAAYKEWTWVNNDWFDTDGVGLTGYNVSDGFRAIFAE